MRRARVAAVAGLFVACAGGAAAQTVGDTAAPRPAQGAARLPSDGAPARVRAGGVPAGVRAEDAPARVRSEGALVRRRAEEGAVRRVLARQFARYPGMQPEDVYKLIFQAAMGSRHAGLDSAMAAEWLAREIASLPPGPEEPILDTISADGRMVRVNLRPYLAAGGSRDALLSAFVRTAREYRGSTADLRRELSDVERMAAAGLIPLARGSLHEYFERMRARGYPAVEHSDAYEAAHHPAYRVVLLPFLERAPGTSPP
jgi:hypothetical protein